MKNASYIVLFLLSAVASAQVGISNTNPRAQLDISASNPVAPANTDGILVPRINAFPAVNPLSDQNGMLVFLTTVLGANQPGFYYWNFPTLDWIPILSGTLSNATLDSAYDFGGAGAGRTITADAGAVTINGTDGLLSTGTFNSGATAPNGTGVKMYWNPRKAAFRAGRTLGTLWDDANVGNYSAAFGQNTTAPGPWSAAFNYGTVASGSDSAAFNFSTTASGDASAAFGSNTTSSGTESIAFGNQTVAAGAQSFSLGSLTAANGNSASAFGFQNTAPSYAETVLGVGATDYTQSASGATQFRTANATDRLLTVGNAIDANNNNLVDTAERSDALIILKSGLTRLPSTTNAMINAADGKAVVTKEYLQNNTSGTLDQAYDFGGAGLGRTITADAGAVTINGTDGFVSNGTLDSGALAPTGAGVKMFWNPRKAAFRAGSSNATNWDDTNIGRYSVAFGSNTRANGQSSTAWGFFTEASAMYATAFGSTSTASGLSSTAFGSGSIASGSFSTAFGQGTVASGSGATAFGVTTTASGRNATAFGVNTTASGNETTAFGNNNTAASYGETVLGIGATTYTPSTNGATQFRTANTNDRLFVIGNAIDANNNNLVDTAERSDALIVLKNGLTRLPSTTNAMINAADGKAVVTKEWVQANSGGTLDQAYDSGGPGTGRTITADAGAVLVSGSDGFQVTGTFGEGATLNLAGTGTRMFFNPRKAALRAGHVTGNFWDDANVGNFSIGLGHNARASGYMSIALGGSPTASGTLSRAIGSLVVASGDESTAIGYQATASGIRSTALGFTTTASGTDATAFGRETIASGPNSTAYGFDTTASGYYSTAFGLENNALSYGETVIGIGATTYTSSANGNAQFRSANATDRLFVIGNAIDANNNNVVDTAERSDALIVLKNGRTGIGRNPATNRLEVNGTASKTAAGDWIANSDARLKKNIETYDSKEALEKLLRLRGVTYEWDDDKTGTERPEGKQLGFIAQEIQQVFPEKVTTDNLGYLQTGYGDYDAVYVQAIKELTNRIESLEKENSSLKAELKTQQTEILDRLKKLEKSHLN